MCINAYYYDYYWCIHVHITLISQQINIGQVLLYIYSILNRLSKILVCDIIYLLIIFHIVLI